MTINETQCRTYLKKLFAQTELVNSYIKVGINNRKANFYKQEFFEIDEDFNKTFDEAVKFVQKNSNCDIYICPNTFNKPDGKKENVNYAISMYADYDEFEGQELKSMPEKDREVCKGKIIAELKTLKIEPTTIVSSGNGVQAYWQLTEVINAQERARVIEAVSKRIAKLADRFQGDMAVTNIAHMLRMPGTNNMKDPENIKPCETIWEEDNLYDLEYLIEVLEIDEKELVVNQNPSEGTMSDTYKQLGVLAKDLKEEASKCDFLNHLSGNPTEQNYFLWLHLAINLAVFGEDGRVIFHKISEKYRGYSKAESEKIFNDTLRNVEGGKYTPSKCTTIGEAGFQCSKNCKQTTPAGMILSNLMKKGKGYKRKNNEINITDEIENLFSKEDEIEDLKLLENFIETKLNQVDASIAMKEAFLRKALSKLNIPERGNFSALKKQIKTDTSEQAKENLFVKIGEEILEEHELAYIGEEFYTYRAGCWKKYDGNINQVILDKIADWYTKDNLNNINFYLKTKSYIDVSKINRQREKNMICLDNGMLKMNSDDRPSLLAHDKDYYALNQVNIKYEPDAECPKWESFLEETFSLLNPEDRELSISALQEWFGYCLIAGNDFHRMMFLIGKSRTGKGVILDILSALLGEENISAMAIGQIDKEFNAINLFDKLVNIGPEIGQNEKFNVAFVKSALGEDLISGRYLHKNLVSFRNNAKFMFASNHVPIILDSSDAMYERALCIPMNKVVPKKKRNYKLKDELKAELSGILNWAIEGRKRLYERERFIESPSMQKLKYSIKEKNNSVLHWFNSEVAELERDGEYILLKQCLDRYRDFCYEEQIKPLARGAFKRELGNIPNVRVERPTRPNQDCVFIDWEATDTAGETEKSSDLPSTRSEMKIKINNNSKKVDVKSEKISEFPTKEATEIEQFVESIITKTDSKRDVFV
ncbi:P4 family phage/plasmid primase-like protein [Desulfitispora alkaliphila]|uniref:DNA primase family protein n=1 Tax=Desulfitispora alkaliphila TaxID=622674 RepID=UPI003D1FC9CF